MKHSSRILQILPVILCLVCEIQELSIIHNTIIYKWA